MINNHLNDVNNGSITEDQDNIIMQCISDIFPSKYNYLTNHHTVIINI